MKIKKIPYNDYLDSIPNTGNHILGQQTENEILVYQAFNPSIANYAVSNQKFGGNHYSFSRMTWIKPNFLWMMYRCGWAQKVNQECVLGIWISKDGFIKILKDAVYSSFQQDIYKDRAQWKSDLENKDVRLQWDPDHDIYGAKQERRAIQLGLKNDLLQTFNEEIIKEIIDVTDFVKTQKALIDSNNLEQLILPEESVFSVRDTELIKKLKITKAF